MNHVLHGLSKDDTSLSLVGVNVTDVVLMQMTLELVRLVQWKWNHRLRLYKL